MKSIINSLEKIASIEKPIEYKKKIESIENDQMSDIFSINHSIDNDDDDDNKNTLQQRNTAFETAHHETEDKIGGNDTLNKSTIDAQYLPIPRKQQDNAARQFGVRREG